MLEKLFSDKRVTAIDVYDNTKCFVKGEGFTVEVESQLSHFGFDDENFPRKFMHSKGKTLNEAVENMIKLLNESR